MQLSEWLVQHQAALSELVSQNLLQHPLLKMIAHVEAENWMAAFIQTKPEALYPVLEGWLKDVRLNESKQDYLAILLKLQGDFEDYARQKQAEAFIPELRSLFGAAAVHIAQVEARLYAYQTRRELERVRRKTGILEKHKSDFISVAAHELKTPLTLIEGYANMLKGDLSLAENNTVLAMLRGITTGTHRLHEIIEDMIDMTMIEMRVMEYHAQAVWLGPFINILASEIKNALEERHLKLVIEEDHLPNVALHVDPERTYQALMKVVENAIKYTPNGGTITISAELDQGGVDIAIQDTGIGLAFEDHEVIFEKFFSLGQVGLHSSSKTKFKGGGPGLGLSIARGIINAQGGKIWVESPGHDEDQLWGSCFHVWLPLHNEDEYN